MGDGLRKELRSIFASLAQALEQEDKPVALDSCRRLCALLKKSAGELAELRWLAGACNLALDCLREVIPRDKAVAGLRSLAVDHLGNGLGSLVRQGVEIQFSPGPTSGVGVTMMKWADFLNFHGGSFGRPRFNVEEESAWWDQLCAEGQQIAQNDLHLSGTHGNSWIADDVHLRQACPEGCLDATLVYDLLGLDWRYGWTEEPTAPSIPNRIATDHAPDAGVAVPSPVSRCRAVLLVAPLAVRRRAVGGLRMPTALDAWGSFLFAPGDPNRPGPWPDVGSRTAVPQTGAAGPPEAVHGPVRVGVDEVASVEALGWVSKPHGGDRLIECGDSAAKRARERLQKVLDATPDLGAGAS